MEVDSELAELASRYAEKYGNCAQASFHTLVHHLRLSCEIQTFARALTAMPGVAGTCETCGLCPVRYWPWALPLDKQNL